MKTFQTVDIKEIARYNYLENSLRIVCSQCDMTTQCMSIFICSSRCGAKFMPWRIGFLTEHQRVSPVPSFAVVPQRR